MFKKRASYAVIASERYLAMSNDAKSLYLGLVYLSDSEGFIEPYSILPRFPFKEADLQLLLDNQFVKSVENGVKVKIDKVEIDNAERNN